jgi:hypothetical protein
VGNGLADRHRLAVWQGVYERQHRT